MIGFIGPTEIVLIIIVVAIFFFGKGKIIEWAKSLGEAKKVYGDSSKGKSKPAKKKKK